MELTIAAVLALVILTGIVATTLSSARLHRVDLETEAVLAACRRKLEELRATRFSELPGRDGEDFAIVGPHGPLRSVSADPDGKPGEILVRVESRAGAEMLYRATATALWRGSSGVRSFSLTCWIADRTR